MEQRDCERRRVGEGGESGWEGECGASCAAMWECALCCDEGTALVYNTSSIIELGTEETETTTVNG